jgi:hypothetical protein
MCHDVDSKVGAIRSRETSKGKATGDTLTRDIRSVVIVE